MSRIGTGCRELARMLDINHKAWANLGWTSFLTPRGSKSYGLQYEGDRRIGRALVFDEFATQPDAQERLSVLEVEDDDGNFSVGVEGGGGDEVVAGGSRGDAPCAGTDEAGGLAQ